MSLAPSNMLELGTKIIDFTLPNVIDNKPLKLSEYAKEKPIVLAFICNHCPYVKHIMDEFVAIANDYTEKGFAFVAISSNDVSTHPDDAPEKMKELALSRAFNFPYCYDESQQAAKDYDAACTPDFYCFDTQHKLAYRGRFDGATPGNNLAVTGEDLIVAMDAVLAGKAVDKEQKPSIGCNIKWKS